MFQVNLVYTRRHTCKKPTKIKNQADIKKGREGGQEGKKEGRKEGEREEEGKRGKERKNIS
jgi:hypothetical protein